MNCWWRRHRWSFPRRRHFWHGEAGVDVQVCLDCHRERRSKVQFGPRKTVKADAPRTHLYVAEAPSR